MRVLLRNFGFPLLVLVALVGAAYLVLSIPAPKTIPDYALQAEIVYRLEVGAACFVVVYLAAMSFFLALDGRGFAEIGTQGLRAGRVIRAADDEQAVALTKQIEANRDLDLRLEAAEERLRSVIEDLRKQELRLEGQERRR